MNQFFFIRPASNHWIGSKRVKFERGATAAAYADLTQTEVLWLKNDIYQNWFRLKSAQFCCDYSEEWIVLIFNGKIASFSCYSCKMVCCQTAWMKGFVTSPDLNLSHDNLCEMIFDNQFCIHLKQLELDHCCLKGLLPKAKLGWSFAKG